RLHVDSRRLEQIDAGRRTRAFHDLADQGKTVRMRAARSEAEKRVAGLDRAAVDDALALDHADGEAGEVVLVLRKGIRMLGGLAADEGAARSLAAARDSLHHLGGDAQVEALADVVVEEE